jgi:hypothetical protein
MSLLFIKRLNDTLEENAEKLLKDGKNEKALIGLIPIINRKKECDTNYYHMSEDKAEGKDVT